MVWGYICFDGMKGIKFINENITGEIYRKMLENTIPNELPSLCNQQLMLQQDNAPAHREESVSDFFNNHGITILKWPAQSPDLNIIEDCWRYLNRRLKDSYDDEADLKKDIREIWENIPQEFISKLYRSIPDRLRAVITSKGGPTKY